jgi:hypothetical protein
MSLKKTKKNKKRKKMKKRGQANLKIHFTNSIARKNMKNLPIKIMLMKVKEKLKR